MTTDEIKALNERITNLESELSDLKNEFAKYCLKNKRITTLETAEHYNYIF